MNATLAHVLVRLYPRHWRVRYGDEFKELLKTEAGSFRTVANVLWAGVHEHLFPTPGLRMNQNSSPSAFNRLCIRVPWAMFAIAPLLLLAVTYLIALFILWSGWRIFLPEMSTPFVPVGGFAIFYFGAGRLLYFGAPILIGWVLALIAARQRLNVLWPTLGLILLAWIGGTAQVHVSRVGGVGQVSLGLALNTPLQSFRYGFFHVLIIFTLTMSLYLILRFGSPHLPDHR